MPMKLIYYSQKNRQVKIGFPAKAKYIFIEHLALNYFMLLFGFFLQ
jgi:hypothetical protein